MITGITHVSVLVDDYDEALQWYTEKLGLEPRMDGAMGEGYRFVTVGVRGQSVDMVLRKPFGDRSAREAIEAGEGAQFGVVFGSDSCRSDTEELGSKGVTIKQGPEEVPLGCPDGIRGPVWRLTRHRGAHARRLVVRRSRLICHAGGCLVERSLRGLGWVRPRDLPL